MRLMEEFAWDDFLTIDFLLLEMDLQLNYLYSEKNNKKMV